jgi:hypothetical protein
MQYNKYGEYNSNTYYPGPNDQEVITFLIDEVNTLKTQIQQLQITKIETFLDSELLDRASAHIIGKMKEEITREMEAFVSYSEETKKQVSDGIEKLTQTANKVIGDAEGIMAGMASKYELP